MSAAERGAIANIPASALADMVQGRLQPLADLRAYSIASGGPTGTIPRNTTEPASAAPPPANTSGWQAERPLQPPPGIALIDAMCVAADQRERQQAMRPDFMEAAMMMLQVQSQQIVALAALVLKDNKPKSKSKPAEAKKP
jgi:hypothetical protein